MAADVTSAPTDAYVATMRLLGWCHNGYHNSLAADVVRRAGLARLDALVIKYGDPEFERAIADAGLPWVVERFAYAAQPEREAGMLAHRCLSRGHATVPLFVAADLRPGRSLDAQFVREASQGGLDGWMALVYPKAFGESARDAFDAAYPGARYLGLPCGPVIQVYDDAGPALVREQVAEAKRRSAASLSIYVVETASDDEFRAVASAKVPVVPDAATLREVAAAYQRGAISILDHGTPAELSAWGELFTARVPS